MNLSKKTIELAQKNFWTWNERIKREVFVINNLCNKNDPCNKK